MKRSRGQGRGLLRRPAAFMTGALAVFILLAAGPPEAPVADAAMRGDVETVQSLLRQGADVNAAQGDGMTALHWAASRGNADLATMLLRAGATVSPVTRIGHYTPLHLASRAGETDVARALLAAGADPAARVSNGGATPLHLAATAGDPVLVRLLLETGTDPDVREELWAQTPLIFAASWNRAEAIQVLMEFGADPDATSSTVDLLRQNELERLANEREDQVFESMGVDDPKMASPREVQAAVMAARDVMAKGELPEEEEEEEDGEFDPFEEQRRTIQAKGGLTPLLHAARQGHMEAAVALLDAGADIDKVSDSDGTTPLLMAAINGQFDMAAYLLDRGADPNIASELNGATPLIAALNAEWQPRTRFPQPQQRSLQNTSYLDLMRALLEAGADPDARLTRHPWYMVYTGCGNRNCGLADTNGATAFWRAAYATDVPAMKLLMEFNADPNIPSKAPPQRQRITTDEFLRRQNRGRIQEKAFAELASDSARLVALGSVRDDFPDSVQVKYTDEKMSESMDEARAELLELAEVYDSIRANEPDPSGLPPVEPGGPGVYPIHAASGVGYGEGFAGNAHRHVPDGWMAAVKYLVEDLGMDVNARDFNGYNAVHHAASRGDNEMIHYLVELGADVTAVSRRGQTTADMANGPVQRVSPFPETVALLESLGSENNDNCLSC